MMKNFRNLILSLFLAAGAAGLAACEGERGPVGEAGPTGTAGVAGPKGAAGDPGRSSDEIPSAYEFLKNWGKADGTAACNDDILSKKAPFPGPATLVKATGNQRRPPLAGTATTISFKVDLGDPDATGNADEGECSNKVFPGAIATGSEPLLFTFTPTHWSGKIERETESGTTAVLGNRTFTERSTAYWGGTVAVDLKAAAAAAEGIDRLAVRCDGRKRPGDVGTGASSGKKITGEYRIKTVSELENILEEDAGGTNVIKDSHTSGPQAARNDYHARNYRTQFCIRLASVPGTVKCLEKISVQERDTANDDKVKSQRKTTEQIALYKGGQLMQAMPAPYSNGLLAGTGPAGPPNQAPESGNANERFPFFGGASNEVNFPPAKICNFFGDAKTPGVIPCSDGKVPNDRGVCGTA